MNCSFCNRYLKGKEDEARHNRIFHGTTETKVKTTVIKCGTKFWTGKHYSEEYPNAKRYANWPTVKEVQKATFEAVALGFGNSLSVYRNYGRANQDRFQFVDSIRNEGVVVSEY